jgi:hypothetical protein
VPELVQHDAQEKEQDKYNAARRRGGTTLRVIAERQPDDYQQERNVNPQLNPADTEDWKRPAHLTSICSRIESHASAEWAAGVVE